MGEVLGYVSEETDTPKESAAEAAKKIFGKNTEKVLPLAVGKFLCIEVGERTASVLEFYTFIVFLESIICLIFGITLPCSLYRHLDPAKAIDNAFVNKNYVYVDNLGHTKGYVGETRAWLVKILLLFLMLFVANIWCTFLPIFIVINFAVGLVMAILRIVGITTSNAAAKAKMKLAVLAANTGWSSKTTFSLLRETYTRTAAFTSKNTGTLLLHSAYLSATETDDFTQTMTRSTQ